MATISSSNNAANIDSIDSAKMNSNEPRLTSSNKVMFPWVMHEMLEDAEKKGFEHVVSWNSSGLSFKVHDRETFINDILPLYAAQTKYKSYVRQLNMWGFSCIHGGRKAPERGSYRNEHFIRGQPHLCLKMKRCKIKGTAKRRKKVPADHDADAGLQQTQKQTKQQPVAAKKCAPPAATAMPKLAQEHDGLASPAPSEKDLIATLASSSNGNPPQHFSTNDFSLLQSLWTSQEMGNLAPAQPPTVPVAAVAGAVNGGNNNASSNSMINGLSGTTSPMFMARQQQQQQQTGTAENVILSSFLDDDLMLKGSRNFDDIGFDMSSESSMVDTMLRNADTFSSSPSDLNGADAMMNNAPIPSQEISQAAPAPAAAPVASYVNSNNNAGAPGACQQLSVESMAQQLYMPRTSQAIAAAYSSLNNLNFLQQQQQQQQQQNAGFFSSNQFCGGAGAHAMPSFHNTAAIETALASISQGTVAAAAAAAFVPTVAASQQAPTTQSPPSASAPSPSFLSGNSQPAAAKPQFSISETLDMLLRSSPKNDNAFEHDGEFVVSEEV